MRNESLTIKGSPIPFKNCCFVCDRPVDLSPVGFQISVIWGPIPGVGALKSWGTRCVVQTLQSSGRSWELGAPSQVFGAMLRMSFTMTAWLSPSYPFWGEYFSFAWCMLVSQPVSEFFLEANLCVHSVCPKEERSSGASDVSVLVFLHKRTFFNYREMQRSAQKRMGTCEKK